MISLPTIPLPRLPRSHRGRLREALGAFVDPAVVERVLREGPHLAGDEVQASVLVLDVRDFVALVERAGARAVVAQLTELWDTVVPVLVRHGGHANKFLGDGLLAVFGAPARHPDHAERAVAAAREIAALVRERYGDELRVGIGVSSGTVVAGTIGGGGGVEFAVIGDPVNTATRVEELTRQTGDDILVTDATRRLLGGQRDELLARPTMALRGKREPVRLWAARPTGRAVTARPEPLPAPALALALQAA